MTPRVKPAGYPPYTTFDVAFVGGRGICFDRYRRNAGVKMTAAPLVVTYPLTERSRAIIAEELGGAAEIVYLAELAPEHRADALRRAGAVLANDTSTELKSGESELLRNAKLLQFT